MKRKALAAIMAVAMAVSMAGCGGSTSESKDSTQKTETADSTASTGGSVENKDKPLCWFNRQPSSSATGELDKDALNFNGNTYYVGFDANQGAELQGQMVLDYIKKNADTIDRNGDGVIGYVLAIGDIGHNDSIARTRGVRSALGTGVDADGGVDSTPAGTNVDGKAKVVQDATLDVDGKTYTIRELASQEMKNSAGATWDAATAGNAIGTWTASFGDQIDVVVSNNDGMGMSMFNAWAKDNKVPTFGYDANSDAVAAIGEGYGGTISQHADVQAYLTLRVLRNALDGVDINTGIGTADEAGNCLTEGEDYRYSEEERSYYALNIAVTADNYNDFTDSTKVYDPTKARQGFWRMQAWLVTLSPAAARPLPLPFFEKRQIIYEKKSIIVKIYQNNKNIENKLKYFKKCVDKCTALYYIKLNKRETEQPNREGWERSTKESIEREVQST